jgi:hypothetical protein
MHVNCLKQYGAPMLWKTTFDAHPQFRTFWKAEKSLSVPCRHFLTSRNYTYSTTSHETHLVYFRSAKEKSKPSSPIYSKE